MPQRVIIRTEFAIEVRQAMGELSPNQASYKTAISDEWIRKMLHGRVPSEEVLDRLARGLDADLQKLRIAAGYDQPADVITAVDLAMRCVDNISDEGKQQIRDFVKRIEKEYSRMPKPEK